MPQNWGNSFKKKLQGKQVGMKKKSVYVVKNIVMLMCLKKQKKLELIDRYSIHQENIKFIVVIVLVA